MAATAISLQLKTNRSRIVGNPSFVRSFSSSSTPEPPPSNAHDQSNTPSADADAPTSSSSATSQSQARSAFASYLSDVKSTLRQQQSPFQRSRTKPNASSNFTPSPLSAEKPSSKASMQDIYKHLSEFRRRYDGPPPAGDHSSFFPSSPSRLPASYNKILGSSANVSETTQSPRSENLAFDKIRESLKQIRTNKPEGVNKGNETMPRSRLTDNFLGPIKPTPVLGGTESLPSSIFGKEREKSSQAKSANMKSEFIKTYTKDELGDKLRMLRPEEATKKEGKWFSFGELQERLAKLREVEEKQEQSRVYFELRESLLKLQQTGDEKAQKPTFHRIDILGQLGGTPNFMLSPPKENLVEKYYHPDNMSSAEKMKIELKKVRDEFKMSESDCGSARVQVAQLTTKIKHLSTVLHKKDKHSRKGLQAMVQQRKKLLKYLRRTDWDSYIFVLSKLGLRDNPDYKN